MSMKISKCSNFRRSILTLSLLFTCSTPTTDMKHIIQGCPCCGQRWLVSLRPLSAKILPVAAATHWLTTLGCLLCMSLSRPVHSLISSLCLRWCMLGHCSHQMVEATMKQAKPAICHTRQHMCEYTLIFHSPSLSFQFHLGKHLLPLFLGLLRIIISLFLLDNSDLLVCNFIRCVMVFKTIDKPNGGFPRIQRCILIGIWFLKAGHKWWKLEHINKIPNTIENMSQ
jgi:hypothetical protein